MSDSDDRLKALFALDAPPAHDPAFVLETARRIQVRRFWLELAAGVPWLVAASAILWASAPWLHLISRPAAGLMAALIPATAVAIGAIVLTGPRSGAV
jgi:hypothetical protein